MLLLTIFNCLIRNNKMDFHCQYDVAIAGAGIAGIAAAIAAARQGKKVALIEKQTLIGGLATSGIVYIYLPFLLIS